MRWCSAARMSWLSAKHSQSVFQITPLLNACQIPPACPPNPKCLSNILAHMMSPGLGGFSAPVRSFPAKPTNRKRPPLESHHTMSQSCHCVPHWHHALTSADLIDPYWSFTGLTASPDFPGFPRSCMSCRSNVRMSKARYFCAAPRTSFVCFHQSSHVQGMKTNLEATGNCWKHSKKISK